MKLSYEDKLKIIRLKEFRSIHILQDQSRKGRF